MPLRKGTLTSLVHTISVDYTQFCLSVLKQMLRALDYLASKNLVHRDLKPDNILYYILPDSTYHFQLADFGLAHHRSLAKTFCGTSCYQAPELLPETSKVYAPQSPKMDVWSLLATMVAVDCRFENFPPPNYDYGIGLSTVEATALQSNLEPMARRHPQHRASAAQMLAHVFNEREGLTTPLSKIPPIEPEAKEALQTYASPSAGPNNPPQTKNNGGKARQRSPLVVYPPGRLPPARMRPPVPANRGAKPTQLVVQPIRAHRDGVIKPRPVLLIARAGRLATLLLELESRDPKRSTP